MSSKVLIIIAAMLSMTLGFWVASNYKSQDSESAFRPAEFKGTLLSIPRKISVPVLQKDDGNDFTAADLKSQWTLIFFGYTHCPDICPTTMSTLAQAKKKSTQNFPGVIFVSVDPERDKPEMLAEYVQYFDPSFRGVTGDAKLVEAFALQMGSIFVQVPSTSGDAENYLVDHSSSISVLNPDGNLVAFISAPHTAENILKALKAVKS